MSTPRGQSTFLRYGWVPKPKADETRYDRLGEGWALLIAFFRWWPDYYVELFRSDNSDYSGLELIQRVVMRAQARYRFVDITGCRGLTKTYATVLENLVEMEVWPSMKISYYGPSYKQMAKIGSQTFRQIEHDFPGLTKRFNVQAESVDRFELQTLFGSSFTIAAFRGDTVHKVIAEEYAQEENPRFDAEEYRRIVLPAVRATYSTRGIRNSAYILYKQHSITSAGRRQNYAYETRQRHYTMMCRGESAFVMDVPYDVVLLSGMRPIQWAESLKAQITPDEWMREMESYYTGADSNPIISDSALTESRCLLMMEEHHCCKDRNNSLKPADVVYILGYDVSYADGARNAKCACVVIKCTKQKEWLKRDKYLKQVVWVDDWLPKNAMAQAKRLKSIWRRFCYDGSKTYIAIDSWQYGTSVVQSLMQDLGDGLPPLCIYKHTQYTEYELEGALPVIYPIKAGGVGTTDPDSEMVRYMELQFEYRNFQLLTRDYQDGMEAYKRYHRIKNDASDYVIYNAYKKTNELVTQIQNLKKVPTASGFSERRISKTTQRDSWSALKYAGRFAQVLERTELDYVKKKSDWQGLIDQYKDPQPFISVGGGGSGRTVTMRRGRLY